MTDKAKVTMSFECDSYQAMLMMATYELLSVPYGADHTVWQDIGAVQAIPGLICVADELSDHAGDVAWTILNVTGPYKSLEAIPGAFKALAKMSHWPNDLVF